MGRRFTLALLATATSLGGCVSALHEPPPVAAIAKDVIRNPVTTSPDRDQILAQAEAAFARRPDVTSVAQARELYLAAAQADETGTEGLLGAAVTTAWLVEHSTDHIHRVQLATEGVQTCQWCLRRAGENIECHYRLALALGQQARERPATAADALPRIIELLEKVVTHAPTLDEAGGHRVLGLVLLRAPGWPVGPGDTEMGLEHALKAVAAAPIHPPNLLVLAEAHSANGKKDDARADYREAEVKAKEKLASGDPDASEWIEQARKALEALQ